METPTRHPLLRRAWLRASALWGTAAALSWACVPVPTDAELPSDLVVVHAVLSTLADTQWLDLKYGMLAVGFDSVAEPVSGADVTVIDGTATVGFAEAEPGRYRALFRAVSGATYELKVRAPGEMEVRGSTTVPDPPVIIDPAGEAFEITDGSSVLPLTWEKDPADSVQLLYLLLHPPQPSSTFVGSTSGTSARLFLGGACGDSCCGTATAIVANPDASLLHRMLMPAGAPGLLDGAEGVFGSMAADTLLVTFASDSLC